MNWSEYQSGKIFKQASTDSYPFIKGENGVSQDLRGIVPVAIEDLTWEQVQNKRLISQIPALKWSYNYMMFMILIRWVSECASRHASFDDDPLSYGVKHSSIFSCR